MQIYRLIKEILDENNNLIGQYEIFFRSYKEAEEYKKNYSFYILSNIEKIVIGKEYSW